MKKQTGCLTTLCVVMIAVIGGILSFDSKSISKPKTEPKQVLIDSLKIDSITIKIYKDGKD